MRNNNKFYSSQDNKSANPNDNERPKFYGKINTTNEQSDERSSNVIIQKQVEENLQMPVFLNSKKTESDFAPINETKDVRLNYYLYLALYTEAISTPISTNKNKRAI